MQVTKEDIKIKLTDYLNHFIRLEELVDWAENIIQEAEYEDETIKDVLSHLGLADVKQFGLTWDDCYEYLSALGYRVKVAVS
ncbi:MAG: hypothetical protein HY769_04425 [Candidatus Stahlbacteria bacterium]|nr:hypothetical protein [Candidatus Stahlbacteria bacterium]